MVLSAQHWIAILACLSVPSIDDRGQYWIHRVRGELSLMMRHDRGLACGTKGDLSYSWSVGQMAVRWELEEEKKQRQSLGDNNTSDQTFMAISSGAKTKWKGPSPYGRLWTSLGSKELDCPVWRREGDQPNTFSPSTLVFWQPTHPALLLTSPGSKCFHIFYKIAVQI